MSSSILRLSLCIVVMASLAGCGGSSSGGSGGGGGGSPTTVTFTFNGSTDSVAPAVVATQTGTGTYALAALSSGKLTIEVPNGETNFSVAYLCPPEVEAIPFPAQNYEYITEASTLDGTSFSGSCFVSNSAQTGVATVQVNAAAIPGAAGVAVDGYPMPWSDGTLDFSATIPAGTYDVPITVSKGEYYDTYDNYLAIKILRAQTVPGALNGGASVVFGASDEVVPQTITYNNLPAGFSAFSPLVLYETSNGGSILLDLFGSPTQYLAVPSGAYQSGDTYLISVGAGGALGGGSAGGVGAEIFTATGGPQTFTFPSPWSYAGPTPAALPTFNFVYSGFSGKSNVSQYVNLSWDEGTTSFNAISMSATANYQNGSTSMTIPDLSSLTGFLVPATSGTAINWNADIIQSSISGTNPPSGTSLNVSNSGAYTEP
jgi:hypothetical protein